ncbi:MAG: hypothetical protein OEQ28_08110, partial [Acidobacteriota bacterium]|nr:hypothetical protein [Acidobacteriota bacterium]
AVTGKDTAKRQKAPADDSFADRRDVSGRRENKPATEKNETRVAELSADMESVSKPPPPVAAGVPAPSVSVITPRGGAARSEAEAKKVRAREQEADKADKKVGDTAAAPVSRTISGKTFTRRNGTWFDSAYKNQATKTIRRGTTEFQALDAGVRSIADQLSGTVVVVWKAKALKIQ